MTSPKRQTHGQYRTAGQMMEEEEGERVEREWMREVDLMDFRNKRDLDNDGQTPRPTKRLSSDSTHGIGHYALASADINDISVSSDVLLASDPFSFARPSKPGRPSGSGSSHAQWKPPGAYTIPLIVQPSDTGAALAERLKREKALEMELYHPPAPDNEEPALSLQQSRVLERVLNGENIFFTGSAGTGKSVLLRAIIKAVKKKDLETAMARGETSSEESMAVTASTGVAALNIGGMTLHSWAGIGFGDAPVDALIEKVNTYSTARARWEETNAVMIDEISMIDGKLLDKLDAIGKYFRKSPKPFGGLQMILCGDFFQLPPVNKKGDPPMVFAFESDSWSDAFPPTNIVSLKEVFRQRDVEFVRLLEEMRRGRLSPGDLSKIRSLDRELVFDDDVPPVQLFPLKAEVDRLNKSKLKELEVSEYLYAAVDVAGKNVHGIPERDPRAVLESSTNFPSEVTLKVGAIVMLLSNFTFMGLCNGSTGKIVDFMTLEEAHKANIGNLSLPATHYKVFPVVEFLPGKHVSVRTPKRVLVTAGEADVKNPNGSLRARRTQVPLILAWALTIHKAQGSTLERVKIDLSRIFADGQTYVALSRASSMESLQVLNFARSKIIVSQRVKDWSHTYAGEGEV